MRNFKTWLTEEHDSSKPHHIYQTSSGHLVHVHLHKDEYGTTAKFHNQTLGGMVTKEIHWLPGAEEPSKDELENLTATEDRRETKEQEEQEHHLHKEDFRLKGFSELFEAKVSPEEKAAKAAAREKAKSERAAAKEAAKAEKAKMNNVKKGKLTANGGGIISEMATHYWLNHHIAKRNGMENDPDHLAEQKRIKDTIEGMGNHPSADTPEKKEALKKDIQLRIDHGRQAAASALKYVRDQHGKQARIIRAGWTSKAGDIPKFTRGHHNDGQENTSDVAVEIANSKNKDTANSDGTHFQGLSMKSSLNKQEITAKNPGADMEGKLDHPDLKFEGDKVGREALEKHVHEPNGTGGMTNKQRATILDQHRAEHEAAGGKDGESEYELKSNEGGRKAIREQNKYLHDHINELGNHEGGHKLVGKMLVDHLFPDTDMPNSKLKVWGDKKEKVKSVVEENSNHPLKKYLKDPRAKFHATLNEGGGAVHIHMTHPDLNNGEPVHVYTTSAKPKSNASKESTMGWNSRVATMH